MKLKLDGYFLGPMLHQLFFFFFFFFKKILVALESRILIWVPLLQAMTLKTMDIMFFYLYTLPLCNFGIALSHAICVIVKYFGELLSKTIWQAKSSLIFY